MIFLTQDIGASVFGFFIVSTAALTKKTNQKVEIPQGLSTIHKILTIKMVNLMKLNMHKKILVIMTLI